MKKDVVIEEKKVGYTVADFIADLLKADQGAAVGAVLKCDSVMLSGVVVGIEESNGTIIVKSKDVSIKTV